MDSLYLLMLLNVMIIISIRFQVLHCLTKDFSLLFGYLILLLIYYIVDEHLLLLILVFMNFG